LTLLVHHSNHTVDQTKYGGEEKERKRRRVKMRNGGGERATNFISNDHHDNIRIRMLFDIMKPSCEVVKRRPLCDIVNQEGTMSSPTKCLVEEKKGERGQIIIGCDGTKSFLSSSIPKQS
jgi:hypothetical protein